MKFSRILLFHLAIAALLLGCKSQEGTSSNSPSREGIGDPDRPDVRVDTRFQETFFKALDHRNRGESDKAYSAFEECIRIAPDKSASAHYELSRIDRIEKNNLNSAIVHARAAVEMEPTNAWYHQELGDVYLGLGKYDLAVKEYRLLEKLNPDNPNALYDQATALLYDGKLREAIEVYDKLEQQSGVYEELSMQKHQLYLELNMPAKAGEELEKLAKAFPEESSYWGTVLQFYNRYGPKEKMTYALEQLIKGNPENGAVHFQLSEYYATTGDEKRSYEELHKAFETTDIDIDQKINILLKYYTLTEFDEAYLKQAYELLDLTESKHPQEAKIFAMYGDYLYRDERDEEALKKYLQAAELDPAKNEIWAQILILEAGLGRFQDVKKDSEKALSYFPNIPEFYLYNGIALERLAQYDEAVSSLNLGKELIVDNANLAVEFYSTLGSVFHKQNKFKESDEAFDAALKINPKNAFVLNNYAYYLAERKSRLDKAAEMASLCNEIDPGNPSFEDTYAWVLYRQGKFEDALTWIQKSHDSGGKASGEVLEHFGDILYKLNRKEDALEKWNQALVKEPQSESLKKKINGQIPE